MKKTSLGELIANAVSHGVGLLLSVAALVILVVISDTTAELIGALVYGISLIILYLSSTLLHSFPEKMKKVFTVFQRLDHASIFLLISGTYTPIYLVLIGSTKAYIILGVLWFLSILGVVFKSIWIHKFKNLHLAIYLLMGWSVVFVFNDVVTALGSNLIWIIIGGLCYTVGVAFYIAKFKYQHFIWHLFVLAGSIFHFISIVSMY